MPCLFSLITTTAQFDTSEAEYSISLAYMIVLVYNTLNMCMACTT